MTYIVSGSTYFVVVVNPGTPDGTTYFRFSCLVSMILNMKKGKQYTIESLELHKAMMKVQIITI